MERGAWRLWASAVEGPGQRGLVRQACATWGNFHPYPPALPRKHPRDKREETPNPFVFKYLLGFCFLFIYSFVFQ